MRLIQFQIPETGRRVGVVDGDLVRDVTSVRPEWRRIADIAQSAIQSGTQLTATVESAMASETGDELSYASLLQGTPDSDRPWVCAPVDHEDRRRVLITGTGLTHTGGMKSRDKMHSDAETSHEPQTDSARMFQMGIDGGKPAGGARGTAPEWFYKGDGFNLKGPGQPLEIPEFALDGGEEPEVAAIYLIDAERTPRRLGFCLGNEWSDHETERINYLYLAPSKLRTCAIGPELVTDLSFSTINLRCSVQRAGETVYDSGPLVSGEDQMCHSLANCEDHHFKYSQHRRPGDIHVHFFGTSRLSFSTRQWKYQTGDVVRIESPELGAVLVNPVVRQPPGQTPTVVGTL